MRWNCTTEQNIPTWQPAKDLTVETARYQGSCLNIAFPAVLAVLPFADFDKTTTTINGERLETVQRVSRFRRFKGLTKFRKSFDGNNGRREKRRRRGGKESAKDPWKRVTEKGSEKRTRGERRRKRGKGLSKERGEGRLKLWIVL